MILDDRVSLRHRASLMARARGDVMTAKGHLQLAVSLILDVHPEGTETSTLLERALETIIKAEEADRDTGARASADDLRQAVRDQHTEGEELGSGDQHPGGDVGPQEDD